jgi:hypothetical protein
MSDYRNPHDPLRRDLRYDPDARTMNTTWGWIAAAAFIVVVLAVAFGVGHQPQTGTNTASNDMMPPAATRMAPPASTTMPPAATPTPPATAPAPISPAPNSPALRNQP